MRRAWKSGLLLVVVLVCVGASFAEPVASLKPTNYVNDFAGVLKPSTISQLNEICRQLDSKADGAQVAVATINSTDGEEIFNYGVDLYQKWGLGKKGKEV